MMFQKFVWIARVRPAPFQPKKWVFFSYVYEDLDGTLYTKADYPTPPLN